MFQSRVHEVGHVQEHVGKAAWIGQPRMVSGFVQTWYDAEQVLGGRGDGHEHVSLQLGQVDHPSASSMGLMTSRRLVNTASGAETDSQAVSKLSSKPYRLAADT